MKKKQQKKQMMGSRYENLCHGLRDGLTDGAGFIRNRASPKTLMMGSMIPFVTYGRTDAQTELIT